MKYRISLFVLFVVTLIQLRAATTFEKGTFYWIRSARYGGKVWTLGAGQTSAAIQLNAPSATNDRQVWTVTELSGSYRLINPFGQQAAHNTSDGRIEATENNGSDESQLWKLEPAGQGNYLLIPANRPTQAVRAGADGKLTLTTKTAAKNDPACQFKLEQSPQAGFDPDACYRIEAATRPGFVLGNGDDGGNNTRIALEATDSLNRGQYWNIGMIDL